MRCKKAALLCAAASFAAAYMTGCSSAYTKKIDSGIESFNRKDYDNAELMFKKAREMKSNATVLSYIGISQLEMGLYEEAEENLQEALDMDGKCASACRGMGILKHKKKDNEGAKKYLLMASDYSDGKTDPVYMDAMKHYAGILYEEKDYKGAIEVYNSIIQNAPNSDMALLYLCRGSSFAMSGDENNAVLDFEKSLQYEDSDYNTYCMMYEVLKEAGFVKRGESFLRRLLNDNRDIFLCGKTYYYLGDYEKAREYLSGAFNEGNENALTYLTLTYRKQNQPAQAEQLYLDYMKKNGETPYMCNQYAAFLIECGRYDEAMKYIDKGLEQQADKDVINALEFNQAVCYEHMGELAKSKELFEEYLNKNPNDEAARNEITYLESRI